MNDVISDGVGRLLQRTVILIDDWMEVFYIDTIYFNRDGTTTSVSEITLQHETVWSEKDVHFDEDGQKRGYRSHELF